jgi:uncharacterized membrane protein YqgA involved in biofilm formation
VGVVIGTAFNAAAIILGGVIGLASRAEMASSRQQQLKLLLGVFTVYVGLRAVWIGLGVASGHFGRAFVVMVAALMLGRLTGHLLRIQAAVNRLGHYARQKFDAAQTAAAPARFADGFVAGTILFCAAPLGTLGALQEGLQGDARALLIKAVMDGLAALAFARVFGWGVVASVVPVVAYQGTMTLATGALAPSFATGSGAAVLYATAGLMVFMVSLIVLQLRKVRVADYLPALVYAPLLAWLHFPICRAGQVTVYSDETRRVVLPSSIQV